MFDWEYVIALHAMRVNRASSPGGGDVSWDFSTCSRDLGYNLELQRGWPFETPLCSARSGLLSSNDGHFRNLKEAWQDNTDASGGEVGTKRPFLVSRKILGFLSIFKKSQASSPLKH